MLTYAEAHTKLDKEVNNAVSDGTQYVVLPLDVAQRACDLFEQVKNEELADDARSAA